MQTKLFVIAQVIRPPFLLLTISCIALGAACAYNNAGSLDITRLMYVLIGALSAHAAVNALNEYCDFKSGLDLITVKTPFSGGSGALPRYPEHVGLALATGLFLLAATALCGLLLIAEVGYGLLWFGLFGILLIIAYTPWLNRNPWLCLLAPGTGFGLLMVPGAYYALTGHHHWLPWLLGSIPFFLTNNLLLINQLPDTDADRKVGRRHFAIVYGKPSALNIIAILYAIPFLLTVAAFFLLLIPTGILVILLLAPAALWVTKVLHSTHHTEEQLPAMAINVAIALLAPIMTAAALYLSTV